MQILFLFWVSQQVMIGGYTQLCLLDCTAVLGCTTWCWGSNRVSCIEVDGLTLVLTLQLPTKLDTLLLSEVRKVKTHSFFYPHSKYLAQIKSSLNILTELVGLGVDSKVILQAKYRNSHKIWRDYLWIKLIPQICEKSVDITSIIELTRNIWIPTEHQCTLVHITYTGILQNRNEKSMHFCPLPEISAFSQKFLYRDINSKPFPFVKWLFWRIW